MVHSFDERGERNGFSDVFRIVVQQVVLQVVNRLEDFGFCHVALFLAADDKVNVIGSGEGFVDEFNVLAEFAVGREVVDQGRVDYQLLDANEGEQANQDGENHQAGLCAGAEMVNVVQGAASDFGLVASETLALSHYLGFDFVRKLAEAALAHAVERAQ